MSHQHGHCNDADAQDVISTGVATLPLKGILARHDNAEGTAVTCVLTCGKRRHRSMYRQQSSSLSAF